MQTRLPQVDKLLRHPIITESLELYKRDVLLRVLRDLLDQLREEKRTLDADEIANLLCSTLKGLSEPQLRKVINGTGVVLNTNLGRAPISSQHLQHAIEVAEGYCNLEINLETGKRGQRASRMDKMLRFLSGAEASIAVNNNAAALVLAVNCFALGKEVIVSRGELIEIGGSFRLPDVIESAGGKLREVGTTNKTRLSDFEKAIGPQTGLVMRCHRSNFEIKGFTEETKLGELVKLCNAHSVPLLDDMGSGVLMNLEELGLKGEPTLEESISLGIDLVTYSGDKLLGGPQAGLISGKREFVQKLAKHPLYRAMRLDKLRLSLLEQTLSSFFTQKPEAFLPALDRISEDAYAIEKRVEGFLLKLEVKKFAEFEMLKVPTNSMIGGGSLPGRETQSCAVLLRSEHKANRIAQILRSCKTPVLVISREEDNIIDFRTVFPQEENLLFASLEELDSILVSTDN